MGQIMKMLKVMKNRFLLIGETIAIFILIAIIAFQQHRYVELEAITWEIHWERDSLAYLENVRKRNQVEYYHMSKDSILKLLPPPVSDEIWTLDEDKSLDAYSWPARYIAKYFKKKNDTLKMNAVFWKLPYNKLPDLYIGFVQDSTGQWIAEDCMQWHDRYTKID